MALPIAAAIPVIMKVGSFILTNPVARDLAIETGKSLYSNFVKDRAEKGTQAPLDNNSQNKIFTKENVIKAGNTAMDYIKNPENRKNAAQSLSNVAIVLSSMRNEGVKSLLKPENLNHLKGAATAVKDVFTPNQENKLAMPPEMNQQLQAQVNQRIRPH